MSALLLVGALLACLLTAPHVRRRSGGTATAVVVLAIITAFMLVFVFMVRRMH